MDKQTGIAIQLGWLGLTPAEWLNAILTGASVLVAIIIASLISPKLAERSARRHQRERLLRILISTSPLPANPDYQGAIGLIPIDFKGCARVLDARAEYLALVNSPIPAETENIIAHTRDTINKQADLIAAIGQEIGFDITRQSLIDGSYVSQGFADREQLNIEAMRSWLRIASALEKNNQMFELTISQNRGPKDGDIGESA